MTEDLTLPFNGLTVTRCYLDYRFGLLVTDFKGVDFRINIAGEFALKNGTEEVLVRPDMAQNTGKAVFLFNKVIETAIALRTGELRLKFNDDYEIAVPPAEKKAAWDLFFWDPKYAEPGPNDYRVVSLPGGGLAISGHFNKR